jgi:hypothetical protein
LDDLRRAKQIRSEKAGLAKSIEPRRATVANDWRKLDRAAASTEQIAELLKKEVRTVTG